jgi:hypothetical protein
MHFLDRRRVIMLAWFFTAAFPFPNNGSSQAQVKPGAGAVVFEMADFIKTDPDPTPFLQELSSKFPNQPTTQIKLARQPASS